MTTAIAPSLDLLAVEQADFYREHGFLHLPGLYAPEEMDALDRDLAWIIDTWAQRSQGWTGPWRRAYMDEETEKKSQLVAIHDLDRYSAAWARAVVNETLAGALADLLGPNVELHHTTLHAKPPQTGHPFPLHQDCPFYEHADGRYVDVLLHLDDTSDENGCIRFLDGSHQLGKLPHVLKNPDGTSCSPHLPTDRYRLEDTVPVPAKRGDVVLFSIFTVHGSYINRTERMRRMVRMGYRDPENEQLAGQSLGRPGPMVRGLRPRRRGLQAFSTER